MVSALYNFSFIETTLKQLYFYYFRFQFSLLVMSIFVNLFHQFPFPGVHNIFYFNFNLLSVQVGSCILFYFFATNFSKYFSKANLMPLF